MQLADVSLDLQPKQITRILFLFLATVLGLHLTMVFCHFVLLRPARAFTQLVDMDLESNIPTFYNTFLFFFTAILFWIAGRCRTSGKSWPWNLMMGIFIFLGIDESTQIHEKLMLVTQRMLNNGHQGDVRMGWLYYAWVLPYALAALFVGGILLKWLIDLPSRTRKGLILSGIIYVTGAVFMEMWSGRLDEALCNVHMSAAIHDAIPCEVYPENECRLYANAGYVTLYTIEELLEMTGLIVCSNVLLKHLGQRGVRMLVRIPKRAE